MTCITIFLIFEHGFERVFEIGFEHGFDHGFQHGFGHGVWTWFWTWVQVGVVDVFRLNKTPVFSRLVLDFILRSSFIRVNVSHSNKISEYSSSEIKLSDNAFWNETTDSVKHCNSQHRNLFMFFYFQWHLFNCLISYNSK